jgi:hypothetical protein
MPQRNVVHNGWWGEWGEEIEVPLGYRIVGLDVRFETKQGPHGDDTAMNGIMMRAKSFTNDREQEPIIVEPGLWGDWRKRDDIPPSHYICGMAVRIEKQQGKGGDDTALNGIRLLHCPKGGDPLNDGVVKEIEPGLWGDWTDLVRLPRNHYLCGLQTRFESSLGSEDDDTALNGIAMLSRLLPTDWQVNADAFQKAKLNRALAAKD